jgi:hypothetical protein
VVLVARWQVIYTHVATAILSASLSFYSGWTVNQWRHDAHEKQAIEQAAAQQRELHALEQKRSSNVIAAQNVARTRETALRRDADSARNALDGLRTQSEAALQSARTSHDACLASTTRFSVALNQCSAEYQAMGAIADNWQSDTMTLRDAWPR